MPCVMGALPSSTSRATEAVLTRAPVNCTLLRRLAALYDSTSPSSYLTMTGYRPASVHEMTVPTYARPSSNVLRTRSPTCAAACGAMSFSREKGEKGRGERERGAYATLTLLLQSCGPICTTKSGVPTVGKLQRGNTCSNTLFLGFWSDLPIVISP